MPDIEESGCDLNPDSRTEGEQEMEEDEGPGSRPEQNAGDQSKAASSESPDEPGMENPDRGSNAVPPPSAEDSTDPPRRLSLFLWTAVVAALLAAVLGFIVRPFAAYLSLKSAVKAFEIDSKLEALRNSGPIGTELARKYLAQQFVRNPVKGGFLITRNQVLFRGLPVAAVIEYLGKPNTSAPRYLNYPLAKRDESLRLLAVRLKNGVVDGIFLDEITVPSDGEEVTGERRPEIRRDTTPPLPAGTEPPALEEMIEDEGTDTPK